jgi:hypothetical protein
MCLLGGELCFPVLVVFNRVFSLKSWWCVVYNVVCQEGAKVSYYRQLLVCGFPSVVPKDVLPVCAVSFPNFFDFLPAKRSVDWAEKASGYFCCVDIVDIGLYAKDISL